MLGVLDIKGQLHVALTYFKHYSITYFALQTMYITYLKVNQCFKATRNSP